MILYSMNFICEKVQTPSNYVQEHRISAKLVLMLLVQFPINFQLILLKIQYFRPYS